MSLSGDGHLCLLRFPLFLWITAVHNLLDHRWRYGLSQAYPGHYGAAAKLERFVTGGSYYRGGQEEAAWDRNCPEREIWWEIAAPQRERLRGYRGNVIRDPNWVAFHRGGDWWQVRLPPLHREARRSV